jgi:hypothetical protein
MAPGFLPAQPGGRMGAGGMPPGMGHSTGAGGGGLAEGAMGALPEGLDAMLGIALAANPDILVAEAKMQEAQAELNQTRLKVTQGVVMFHQKRRSQLELIQAARVRSDTMKARVDTGTAPQSELDDAVLNRAQAEAQLLQIEGEIRYVLGLGGQTWGTGGFRSGMMAGGPGGGSDPDALEARPVRVPRPALPDGFEALLGLRIRASFADVPILDFADMLQSQLGGSHAVLVSPILRESGMTVTLQLPGEVPLRLLLLALHDRQGDIVAVAREYGLLLTTVDEARSIQAATIPEDIPYVPEE